MESDTHYKSTRLDGFQSILEPIVDSGAIERRHAIYVSLGPTGAYFCRVLGVGQSHYVLDSALDKEIKSRQTSDPRSSLDPLIVALGLDGSYVLVGEKGDLFWDLKGRYGDLDNHLMEAKSAVVVSHLTNLGSPRLTK
jgi:hypothetical protein